MTSDEILAGLRDIRWQALDYAFNRSGQALWRIGPDRERPHVMFQKDVADFLTGRATLEEIAARNKGADLAFWPVPN